MTDTDLIKKSVTQGDYAESPRGGVIQFIIPSYGSDAAGMAPEPPPYWTPSRDWVLRNTVHHESMWAGAISIAATKMASQSWEIKTPGKLRAKRAHDLLNRSLTVKFMYQHLRDYLTTDNGVFTEIVRATRGAGSRILGLVHLDSMRCTRTGDPDIPVLYRDRKGREHEMKAHQVICMADMPDPGDTYFGVGLCAASRAYKAIYKLHAMERYVSEKVSGKRALAIHFVNAVNQNQLESAIESAKADSIRKGYVSYMGAVLVPLLDAEKPPNVATVPLAELPDGFNRKEEFDIAVLTYANDIGLDPQDLQPLTGQPLGTGAQSQVLDDKAAGKGLVTWRRDFTDQINDMVLDDLTTMHFVEKDYRDLIKKAEVSKARAEVSNIRSTSGITTPEQELNILVDLDELPKEFLPVDATEGENISDIEKPDTEDERPEAKPEAKPEAQTLEASAKEADISILDEELQAAVLLFEEVKK